MTGDRCPTCLEHEALYGNAIFWRRQDGSHFHLDPSQLSDLCVYTVGDGVCGYRAREHAHGDPEGCIHRAWPDNCCEVNWHPYTPWRAALVIATV